jgi:hypothetical protein
MFDSENMFLVVPLALIGFAVVGTIATYIHKYASDQRDLDFKRDLVERGLSVDEIERIVAAKPSKNKGGQRVG